MITCECCDIKLTGGVGTIMQRRLIPQGSMVVTLWGLFCSQSCADNERDFKQHSEDRDFEWRNDPNY
jgi:hypothetical protein